jgi:hypothetical protein
MESFPLTVLGWKSYEISVALLQKLESRPDEMHL